MKGADRAYNEVFADECSIRAAEVETVDGGSIHLDSHQREGMEGIVDALRDGSNRLSVVHAGGSGKTVLESALLLSSQAARKKMGEQYRDFKDLILVTERSLTGNVEDHVRAVLGDDVGVVGVKRMENDRSVIMATVQILARNRHRIREILDPEKVGLVVGDEADKFLTEARRQVLDLFPNANRIGFTATPEWRDGRSITDVFGDIVHRFSLKEAMRKGVCVPISYYLFEADVDSSSIKVSDGDYERKSLSAAMCAVEIEHAIPEVYKSIVSAEQRKKFPTIVRVPSINLLENTVKNLTAEFGGDGVVAVGWTGDTPNPQLAEDINKFQSGKIDILVICQMGGRGLNLPRARFLIDANPSLSSTSVEQLHSRVTRTVRSGTALADEGFEKPFSIVAQIVPKSLSDSFRPVTLLDILGEFKDYFPGRILGVDANCCGRASMSEVVELSDIVRRGSVSPRITLLREVKALEQISLYENVPMADEDGFVCIDGERYATFTRWGREISCSCAKVGELLEPYREQAITAKDSSGHLLKKAFYSETVFRKACKAILRIKSMRVPKADSDGFFEKDGARCASLATWIKTAPYDNFSVCFLRDRLCDIGVRGGIEGVDAKGTYHSRAFFSEEQLKKAVDNPEYKKIPRADENGVLVIGGVAYRTCYGWSQIYERLSNFLKRCFDRADLKPVVGKVFSGPVFDFYSEEDVKRVMTAREDIPKSNKDGFFVKSDVLYGVLSAWAKKYQGVLAYDGLAERVRKMKLKGCKGVDWNGKLLGEVFYSESQIRLIYGDLLEKIGDSSVPIAGDDGSIRIGDEEYRSLRGWVDTFGKIPKKDVVKAGINGILGKSRKKGFFTFYSRASMEKLRERKTDVFGFVVIDGARVGHLVGWERYSGAKSRTIRWRMIDRGAVSVAGRAIRGNGAIPLYSSGDFVRTCPDFLPVADQSGFLRNKDARLGAFIIVGKTFGMVEAWARKYSPSPEKIPAVGKLIEKEIKDRGIVGFPGVTDGGEILTDGFYREDVILKICTEAGFNEALSLLDASSEKGPIVSFEEYVRKNITYSGPRFDLVCEIAVLRDAGEKIFLSGVAKSVGVKVDLVRRYIQFIIDDFKKIGLQLELDRDEISLNWADGVEEVIESFKAYTVLGKNCGENREYGDFVGAELTVVKKGEIDGDLFDRMTSILKDGEVIVRVNGKKYGKVRKDLLVGKKR
jgi:superfamily II DNA or RNA helicase